MGIADTAFVAKLGVVPLASLGPNNTAFSFISFFAAFSLSVVVTDRISTCRAQGNPRGGELSMSVAITIAVYLGLAFGLGMLLLPRQVLTLIGANEEIMADAVAFMRVRALSVPALLVSIAVEGAYRAFLDLRTPFVVIAAAAVLNVALNAWLLFGLSFGVRGSALATTASSWFAALSFAAALHLQGGQRFSPEGGEASEQKPRSHFLRDGVLFWRVCGSPVWRREAAVLCGRCAVLVMRASMIVAVYSVAGAVAARIGTAEVAGHQVLRQLLSLQVCLTWAYMSVGQSLVANLYESGAEGRATAGKVAERVVLYGTLTASVLCFGTWLARDSLPSVVVDDASVLRAIKPAMLPACVMLLASANNAFEGVLLGAGDVVFCTRSFFPAAATAVAILFYSLWWHADLRAIWWALACYYCILFALFFARATLPGMNGPLHIFWRRSAPESKFERNL